jgi:triacylglycerol lipase/cholesterol oxidase
LCVAASLSSGQLTGIKSFYSNCVTFTPKIHPIAKAKITLAPFFLDNILGYAYLSPQIPYMPGLGFGKFLSILHKMLRHECNEPACHMVSFMWGWGFPAAYQHENISEVTHRRVKDLFGATSTSYYRHLGLMARKQESIPYKKENQFFDLPDSYLMNLKNIDLPPTRLVAGAKNKIFPGSNKLTFQKIQEIAPHQNVEYIEFENYGHQDIFIGKNSAEDIFPSIIEFLNKYRSDNAEGLPLHDNLRIS